MKTIIRLLRFLFGTRIYVTQEHIDKGGKVDDNESPVTIAINEKLAEKYGMVAQLGKDGIWRLKPRREIHTTLFMFTEQKNSKSGYKYGMQSEPPKSVYDFLIMYDFDGTAKPFSFKYCI